MARALSPPQAICFDLDDTLLDGSRFAATVDATCRQLAARLGDVSPEQLLQANGSAFAEVWREVDEPWTLGKVATPTIMQETWRRALASCGYDDGSLAAVAYEIHAPLAAAAHTLFDDALEVLGRLQLPRALITNGASDLQREKLGVTGIAGSFDAIVISGEHGVAKPDTVIFEQALAELGTDPEYTWHIGDNLHADVGGANAAGLHSVWINRRGSVRAETDPEPDLEVSSLMELLELLA